MFLLKIKKPSPNTAPLWLPILLNAAVLLLPAIPGLRETQRTPEQRLFSQLQAQIKRNRPDLQDWRVWELAVQFERVGLKFKVDPKLLSAIAMQESGYTLNVEHCYRIAGRIRCDSCMMQINDLTARSLKVSIPSLMANECTCVESGARILADLRSRYGAKEKDWFTRYNASSKSKRRVYGRLVRRFL